MCVCVCVCVCVQKLSLHPLNDPTEFGSLSDLFGISRKEGFVTVLSLLCRSFVIYFVIYLSLVAQLPRRIEALASHL